MLSEGTHGRLEEDKGTEKEKLAELKQKVSPEMGDIVKKMVDETREKLNLDLVGEKEYRECLQIIKTGSVAERIGVIDSIPIIPPYNERILHLLENDKSPQVRQALIASHSYYYLVHPEEYAKFVFNQNEKLRVQAVSDGFMFLLVSLPFIKSIYNEKSDKVKKAYVENPYIWEHNLLKVPHFVSKQNEAFRYDIASSIDIKSLFLCPRLWHTLLRDKSERVRIKIAERKGIFPLSWFS